MELVFYLSAGAFLVSLASLAWSIHIGRRDRGTIKATSKIVKYGNVGLLEVKAVNHGRRPVILTTLWGEFQDGKRYGSYLKNRSLRLDENEKFEITMRAGDMYTFSQDGEAAVDFWFEDTLGIRYKVKNARENLKKLWA
jgi:hypothetical protein